MYEPAGDTDKSMDPSEETQVVGSTFVKESDGGLSTFTVAVTEAEQLFAFVAVTV